MKPLVLIQCRASSTRLPGKALLPVRGVPSVLLCAQRAANTGLEILVVISDDPSDDELWATLEARGIPCCRGSLQDVLSRFNYAIEGRSDDTPVVRLTADNLYIDGALIEEAVEAFHNGNLNYLGLHPPALTGAPYGLSAEVTWAKNIREAHRNATDGFDREHVTPWIIRAHGLAVHRPAGLQSGLTHLRCTMDSWSDYQRVLKSFRQVPDPVRAGWQTLVGMLQKDFPENGFPLRFSTKGSIAELALGTVQIGVPYGVSNTAGQPSFEIAKRLVECAVAHGVTHLDCAADYGSAESRLGRIVTEDLRSRVTVVTKLAPLTDLREDCSDEDTRNYVEASVYRSLANLRLDELPVLLLHRWHHRSSHGGRVWAVLRKLQEKGVVGTLGASVQSPAEAIEAITDPEIKFIQLPVNLLDRRFQRMDFPARAKERTDVIIQARSVFLQGLLLMPPSSWPEFSDPDTSLLHAKLQSLAESFKRDSIAELCVAYVRAQPWVDCMVVGMQNADQLKANAVLFKKPPLSVAECQEIEAAFPNLPECLLNPARWKEARKA
ncbi:MAG: hypothetical protein RLZZ179_1014 [Verrucomicrobiota bacterium]